MLERRLDEDDPNWVLANHGRGTGPPRYPRERLPHTERELEHRADMCAVFVRLGRSIPNELRDDAQSSDPWRDDWTPTRFLWFAFSEPMTYRDGPHRRGRGCTKWA